MKPSSPTGRTRYFVEARTWTQSRMLCRSKSLAPLPCDTCRDEYLRYAWGNLSDGYAMKLIQLEGIR